MRGQDKEAEKILYGQLGRLHPVAIATTASSALATAAMELMEEVSAGEIAFIRNTALQCNEAEGLVAVLCTPYCLHMPDADPETELRTQFYIAIDWDPSEHDPHFILYRRCFNRPGANQTTGDDSADNVLVQRDRDIQKILDGLNTLLKELQQPSLGEVRSAPLAGAKARQLPQPYMITEADLLLAIEKFRQIGR